MQTLRVWRASADHGVVLLPMDELYHLICHDFVRPAFDPDQLSSGAEDLDTTLSRLQIAASCWSLAAALLRSHTCFEKDADIVQSRKPSCTSQTSASMTKPLADRTCLMRLSVKSLRKNSFFFGSPVMRQGQCILCFKDLLAIACSLCWNPKVQIPC